MNPVRNSPVRDAPRSMIARSSSRKHMKTGVPFGHWWWPWHSAMQTALRAVRFGENGAHAKRLRKLHRPDAEAAREAAHAASPSPCSGCRWCR
ncbi:hypothetical protein FHT71_003061 [Rhizobium sp. BK060]|nr:hypothetical protein [Rhizobium sp. BK060]